MPSIWQHGDKKKVAEAAELSPQYLGDILKGRKAIKADKAKLIQKAAAKLGYHLTLLDLLDPSESSNPLIG